MPFEVGGKKFSHLRNFVSQVKKTKPGVEDPEAYAASVAANIEGKGDKEEGFKKLAAARKAKG